MKKLNSTLILLVSAYTLTACNVEFSTAKVASLTLSKNGSDNEAVNPTTTFAPTEKVIHCYAILGNAPSDTKVRARWVALNAKGIEANTQLMEQFITAGGGKDNVHLQLKGENGLPLGEYRIEIYLNPQEGKPEPPAKSLDFSVRS